MIYKEIYSDKDYPILLDTFDKLNLDSIPPWEFIRERYDTFWNPLFHSSGLIDYVPFARMTNDDVVAAFKPNAQRIEIFHFTLPLNKNSTPFRKIDNINEWLKLVLNDSYEFITEF
jgi:hypothetical protein